MHSSTAVYVATRIAGPLASNAGTESVLTSYRYVLSLVLISTHVLSLVLISLVLWLRIMLSFCVNWWKLTPSPLAKTLAFVDVLALRRCGTLHLAENTDTAHADNTGTFLDCLLPHNLWLLNEFLQRLDHRQLAPVLWR